MKKKIIALLLSVTTLAGLVLTGCSSSSNDETQEEISPISVDGIEKPKSDGKQVTLNLLNWADYMEENVIEDFEKEYPNIKVYYETMTSNEEMLVKLESTNSEYDLCFPSDYTISKLIKKDLLLEIDDSKLPHIVNIDDRFLNLEFDPDNKYSVPYFWGTVGVLYNKNDLDGEVPDSWNYLWDQKYAKKIFMYDSVRDSMAVALARKGHSINTTNEAELAEAEADLIEQKKIVLAYQTDELRDRMIGEGGTFAVMYSGDAFYSIGENNDLDYFVPKEGSNIWFDNIVLLKSSKNPDAAHLFIDFLLRSDIAVRNTEYIGYSTPNKTALEKLPAELRENEVYNPPQDVIDRCDAFVDLGDFMKNYNDAWLRIKAAK